jgi:hypothetical protein
MMTVYEDAKSNLPLACVVALAAFAAGWSGSEVVMKVAGQDKVTAGTYVLKAALERPDSGYISRADYDTVIKEKDGLDKRLEGALRDLEAAKAIQSQQAAKQEVREQLEQEKTKVEASLKAKRLELVMCNAMMAGTKVGGKRVETSDVCATRQRDIQLYEDQVREIGRRMLDTF